MRLLTNLMTLAVVLCMVISPLTTLKAADDDHGYAIPDPNQPTVCEPPRNDISDLQGKMPVVDVNPQGPLYAMFSGTIVSITELDDVILVQVINAAGGEAIFTISAETILPADVELVEGAEITGFFYANLPMTMQYPAKYDLVLVINSADGMTSVLADLFVRNAIDDQRLINLGGDLVLNIGEDTEIVDIYGNPVSGNLVGHKLLIYYTITTLSLPAQTTPVRIVVLDPTPVNNQETFENPVTLEVRRALRADISARLSDLMESFLAKHS